MIRSLLVPAIHHCIGPANWYMPAWLDRILPNLSVEAADLAQLPTEETPVPVLVGVGAETTHGSTRPAVPLPGSDLQSPLEVAQKGRTRAFAADASAFGTANDGSESHIAGQGVH